MKRQYGALALGATFAAGTVYVLTGDVRSPSDISVDHVMTLLVLAGTIAAGHMLGRQVRELHLLRAAGLSALFLAGTFYCVTSSAARNAEATARGGEALRSANLTRHRAEADLAEAKEDLRRQREALVGECSSGDGTRCRGRRSLVETASARASELEARLAAAAPERRENAGLAHAARVFASLPWVTAAPSAIETTLVLIFPFAKACFLEVACLIFLGIGLGDHAPRTTTRDNDSRTGESISEGDPAASDEGESVGCTREEALDDLRGLLASGAVCDGRMLSRRWNVSETTTSRWLSSWTRAGLIGRARDGRSRRPTSAQ